MVWRTRIENSGKPQPLKSKKESRKEESQGIGVPDSLCSLCSDLWLSRKQLIRWAYEVARPSLREGTVSGCRESESVVSSPTRLIVCKNRQKYVSTFQGSVIKFSLQNNLHSVQGIIQNWSNRKKRKKGPVLKRKEICEDWAWEHLHVEISRSDFKSTIVTLFKNRKKNMYANELKYKELL